MSRAAGPQRNLCMVLDRAAARFGDREAVRFEDRGLSFLALQDRARRVANGLAALGIDRGDRVAVLLQNGLEWVEVLFGLAERGAVCVPVNVLLRPAEVAHLCEDADVVAIIVDQAGADLLGRIETPPPLVVTVGGASVTADRAVEYSNLLHAAPTPRPDGPDLHDDMILYYSSGTTGMPKAAVHTHDTVLWNSFHQLPDLGITSDDTYLVVPSLSWAAGFHDVMLAALWVGGRSVILPSRGTTIDRIAAVAADQQVTTMLLVPTLLKQLLGAPEVQQTLRSVPLRFVLTGAEPVPLPVIEAFSASLPGTDLLQGYGLSEFPTIATILREDEAATWAGWAGRANSITQLAVADDDGVINGHGTGEILLRSPATMQGYWRRAKETEEIFADGWLHTGDVGEVDEEGFLKVTGRKKDMIISGGLNVYPSEVETVVYRFDGVREAAVVGLPDPQWGEVPVVIVVADPGFDEARFMDHCRDQLAGYKTPRVVMVRDEPLPRTPSGKVLKRELRPWAESQQEASSR